MAYNYNFYNDFQVNNFTFQNQYPMPFSIPPPPSFLSCPYGPVPQMSDQEFLKTFEKRLKHESYKPKPNINITELKAKLLSLITTHEELTEQHKKLLENVDTFSDDEWMSLMNSVASKKEMISKIIKEFDGYYMEQARKYLAKRKAKRSRLKRLKKAQKQVKFEWIKEMKEKSRKIDENLQKVKDDILKAKKAEESKLEADLVLKDVQRKKNDAKKYLTKLDALLRLRLARQNTAIGRGQSVSETDAVIFEKNIEKLKSLWNQRLDIYNKEECNLEDQLSIKTEPLDETLKNIDNNLAEWRVVLFGGSNPQAEFGGNVEQFIAVRRQWDTCMHSDGSVLPVGWAVNL